MKLFLRACPAVKGFEGYREKGENVRICRNTAVDLPGKEKMNILHEILTCIVNFSIIIFEFMGVAVIIAAGAQGICNYIRRDPLTRLRLAKGMAMGLEFKLGSEILRMVLVREFGEILLVGAIIVLRAALTLLIHWEIKNEKAEMES